MHVPVHPQQPRNDYGLLENIDAAAKRLYDKLRALDLNQLEISDYNKRYFGNYLARLIPSLQHYSHILSISLAESKLNPGSHVFVDYGGGCGMMSLLAKELGVGTVIYCDIYDVSCCDARAIARTMGIEADYYVCGDVDTLLRFLRENSLSCSAIASFDVIEHIYDIESFLKRLPLCSDGQLTIAMASGANDRNPWVRRKLMKAQLGFEHKDREKEWGHKEGHSCLTAYQKVRKDMILAYLRELDRPMSNAEVEQLARNTRGMIESDLRVCVDDYVRTGKLPAEPTHPTNTCDPFSGNWAEHLMDQRMLKGILASVGFRAEVLPGRYWRSENPIKAQIGKALNLVIRVLGRQSLGIAPFFVLLAERPGPVHTKEADG